MRPRALRHPARGRVRELEEADLGEVVDLHRRSFGATALDPEELHDHLADLFFGHPWRDTRLPSLAYQDADGRIAGCLGVMPRPMSLGGRPILATVSHDFMVDPGRRSTMAALELLRAYFAGPQDLSLAEGNDASRRLWRALGAGTSLAFSLRWTCPLRPARWALDLAGRRGVAGWQRAAARPAAALADLVAARLPGSPFRLAGKAASAAGAAALEAEPLDARTLAGSIRRLAERRSLAPVYTPETLGWMLGVLEHRPAKGELRRALLTRGGEPAGWYLYYSRPGGTAEVIQVGAAEENAAPVLDHLLSDARHRGALAATGLLDPAHVAAFSERPCLFHRGRSAPSLLVQARDPEILQALHTGDAFFTHLEGEFWV